MVVKNVSALLYQFACITGLIALGFGQVYHIRWFVK